MRFFNKLFGLKHDSSSQTVSPMEQKIVESEHIVKSANISNNNSNIIFTGRKDEHGKDIVLINLDRLSSIILCVEGLNELTAQIPFMKLLDVINEFINPILWKNAIHRFAAKTLQPEIANADVLSFDDAAKEAGNFLTKSGFTGHDFILQIFTATLSDKKTRSVYQWLTFTPKPAEAPVSFIEDLSTLQNVILLPI